MWTILFDILKALAVGDFKRLWQEHKEDKAQNDQAKVDSLSGKQLDKQFNSDLVRKPD